MRKMGMSDIGPLMQNAMRFFAAFCFMIAVLTIRRIACRSNPNKNRLPVIRQIKFGIIIGAAFGTAAMLQQLGLMTVSAGEVGFITSLYTVLVPLIMWIFFREKIKPQVWIGMAISFLGLIFVTNGGMGFEPGFIILFMGSIMYAVQIILIGRYIKEADPLILVTIQVMMGVVVNLAMAVLLRETFEFSMVKEAIIFLGESLSLVQGAGCAMIFCAVIISQLERKSSLKLE